MEIYRGKNMHDHLISLLKERVASKPPQWEGSSLISFSLLSVAIAVVLCQQQDFLAKILCCCFSYFREQMTMLVFTTRLYG